jgi:membrane-associated phospholipid phosphatase
MNFMSSLNLNTKLMKYISLFLICLVISCSKDIQEANMQYPKLSPKRGDENAGKWKPILLSSPSEISCPLPVAISSAQYQGELAEILTLQKEMTEAQKSKIQYWASGSVLRWNEIMRELVAKNNIAPYQNPDGTYPVPSAANPFAYPTFPFANPPYAARAYAYLSAAQYDALVSAYHYKSVYKRSSPSDNQPLIQSHFSNTSGSSFPSEDAAVMAASVEILKLLFPADTGFILEKSREHMLARKIGGGNVAEELEAGKAIGTAVALKYITRARSDGAGAAVGTPAIWESMKQSAIAKGETPWLTQESPPRPPMLPLFGQVKPFLFNTADVETTLRPVAPHSTSSAQFKKELAEVYEITSNLTREQERICIFWADGVRTYTPPGHWNYLASEDFVQQQISEVRWARNLALLNMSLMDAAIVCWNAKYHYFNPRPMQIDSRIKTTVGLPNFPSYISGHSTFSGAAATILSHLTPSQAGSYHAMAKEASESRIYGGIHYRSDCEIGLTTGYKVGSYAVTRAKGDGAD